ncbi:hypothetical protein MH215_14170 [Paenibacillus sp. ACRSA]|uniref:hypothetical protein n=1 Tax=Paenibacillus sp. ACRSA TaxID=2918211 RepID=UPI001EF730EF|nr:hypothetical protein [Paenibacillus sp. ACRSA]MCG7378145.1 hypothetical protein [Paenibacillus sp. ACRSA]
MSTYQVIPMIYHSKEQIDAIISLEQQCKQLDSEHLKADLDHISKKDGDHALLCYRDSELVGLLSWYASDPETGSVNAIYIHSIVAKVCSAAYCNKPFST